MESKGLSKEKQEDIRIGEEQEDIGRLLEGRTAGVISLESGGASADGVKTELERGDLYIGDLESVDGAHAVLPDSIIEPVISAGVVRDTPVALRAEDR
ncbi:MAG: hypothetical protein ABEJ66_00595, partial [Candidatus Nanohaloarchaea archaeon]